MEEKVYIPIHQTLKVGMMLAVVGGFLDAYTYLLEGHVFANAQTGNIVLLCILLAEGLWLDALYYLAPILSYFIGILVTEAIRKHYKAIGPGIWRMRMLTIEIILLAIIAFTADLFPSSIINVSISFISAMQGCTFKNLVGQSYVTMTCTGNLRSATRHLFRYLSTKDKESGRISGRYYAIIGSFCIGAFCGTFLVHLVSKYSILLCCFLLFIVLKVLSRAHHKKHEIESDGDDQMSNFQNYFDC